MAHISVIASNRGPVSFDLVDGGPVPRKAAGGLSAGLGPILANQGITWVAAAVTDGDRAAADINVGVHAGFETELVKLQAERYRMAYDVIANGTLWFMLHDLWDLPRRPSFGRHWHDSWEAFRELNHAFAKRIAAVAPPDGIILVQDYHLALVGAHLKEIRPDLKCVHFSHTPFCGPDSLMVLPAYAAQELLLGMTGYSACGFHTTRWAKRFEQSCEELLGEKPKTFVSPLPSANERLLKDASSAAVDEKAALLRKQVGERAIVSRIDRVELSKNVLRGFSAFEEFLLEHPEWMDRVVFCANLYPSRESVVEYQAYRTEIEWAARRVNERFGTDSWTPILLGVNDDFPTALAILREADVVVVNPIRDGLNLVAREAVLVNSYDAVLILSREAGIADELGPAAITVNPYDISETATAMFRALTMDPDERTHRAAELRKLATARSSTDWLDDQLNAAKT